MKKVKPRSSMLGKDSVTMFTARAQTLRLLKVKLCLCSSWRYWGWGGGDHIMKDFEYFPHNFGFKTKAMRIPKVN